MDFREYYEILDEENKKNVKNAIVQKLLAKIEITDFSKYVDGGIETLMRCVVEDIDLTETMDAINEKLIEKIKKVL